MAGKFVELHELLPSNIVPPEPEPEPRLVFNGRLVLTSPPKRPKQRIKHIATWLEAFSIYCLILESYFPYRWKDLLQYQLFILRTYRQFSGRVWLSYDRAFRENATATNLTDWSQLNSTLFSFHGTASSQITCKSWIVVIAWPLQRPAVLPQVCQLSWPAPGCSLPGQHTHQAQLVFQAFSRLTAS